MDRPTLVVVSGPPGSGKTTLAHTLARAIPCPAICRDEIKEGMVHAVPGFKPAPGDELTVRTLEVFFSVLRTLVEAGVTVVAEAAFQDKVWRPRIEPLLDRCELRTVRCSADSETIRGRVAEHATHRSAHADAEQFERLVKGDAFAHVSIEAPTIEVDTSDGYQPSMDDVVAFINRRE